MASVRFVFEEDTEITVKAKSDRGAKLMVTGVRKRLDAGASLIEIIGEDGSHYINAQRLAYVELLLDEGASRAKVAAKAAVARRGRKPAAAKVGTVKHGRPAKAAARTTSGSTAPKRRGRPPGTGAKAIAAKPAIRRGRPPKSRATTASPAPKKRGRPPKSAVATSTAPKRRGRPPKAVTAASAAAAPKKRGRPKKN